MIFNKRREVKESTLGTNYRQVNSILSHKKMKSSQLLEKKPQLLIMKWNDFLAKYHYYKQLNDVNNSLITVGCQLRKKKEQT